MEEKTGGTEKPAQLVTSHPFIRREAPPSAANHCWYRVLNAQALPYACRVRAELLLRARAGQKETAEGEHVTLSGASCSRRVRFRVCTAARAQVKPPRVRLADHALGDAHILNHLRDCFIERLDLTRLATSSRSYTVMPPAQANEQRLALEGRVVVDAADRGAARISACQGVPSGQLEVNALPTCEDQDDPRGVLDVHPGGESQS